MKITSVRSFTTVVVILLSALSAATQEAKLTAPDGAESDSFGISVSVSGDTAVVGAMHDDDSGTESGSAQVFVRSGATWTLQAKLTAIDGAAYDWFGGSVAVSGDTAVVAAWRDDYGGLDAGSAYVFVRNGATWTQQAKLTPSDVNPGAGFGVSVSVSGDLALIGTPVDADHGYGSGAAYVFVRNGTTWTQQAKLTADDASEGDRFGFSVSLSGETAVVGSLYDNPSGSSSGSVYVFVRSGGGWTQQAKLTADDGVMWDMLGISVSVSGDTVVAGAHGSPSGAAAGMAYVFVRNGSSWTQQTKLVASDGAAEDYFGHSVSVSGDTVVIGAHGDDDNGDYSGAAYVFARSATTWTEKSKLLATDGAANDYLGSSVSVSGDTALVGAPYDDDHGQASGAAYVFRTSDAITAYGFGVGCPCANDDPTAGCRNATGSGAVLSAGGSTSVSADDLVLTVGGTQANVFGLIYMGPDQASVPFGDGLRVVQPGPPGGFCRFPVHFSGASGSYAEGPGIVSLSGSFGCGPILAGERWNFQGYYRDSGGPCGSGFNLTNGLSVLFGM